MKFSFEGPGNKKKLKETSVSEGGYPVYEWSENWSPQEIQEFLGRMSEVVGKIATDDMSDEERKSVGDLSVAAMAGALAAASPNADVVPEEVDPIRIELTDAANVESGASPAASAEREIISTSDSVEDRLEALSRSPHFMAKIQAIAADTPESKIKIGQFNSSKPVIGAEELSRAAYATTMISFEHPDTGKELPSALQDELRRMIEPQINRESLFDNSSVNKVTGAFGTVQAMVKTAVDEGYDPAVLKLSFIQQIEFMGSYYARMYGWLNHHTDPEAMAFFKEGLSDEEFQREFLAPALMSSYHAGVGTVSNAINTFYEHHKGDRFAGGGYDRFLHMAEFAQASNEGNLKHYSEHSKKYVPYIYGEDLAFKQYAEQQKNQTTRVAFSGDK